MTRVKPILIPVLVVIASLIKANGGSIALSSARYDGPTLSFAIPPESRVSVYPTNGVAAQFVTNMHHYTIEWQSSGPRTITYEDDINITLPPTRQSLTIARYPSLQNVQDIEGKSVEMERAIRASTGPLSFETNDHPALRSTSVSIATNRIELGMFTGILMRSTALQYTGTTNRTDTYLLWDGEHGWYAISIGLDSTTGETSSEILKSCRKAESVWSE